MKKKTHTPATALFGDRRGGFEPAPELLPELDELLRLNAKAPAGKRVGPSRLSQWFEEQHGVIVSKETLVGWMRRRSREIGVK